MLRGSTIKTINIINRRFSDQTKHFMKKFYAVPSEIKKREGWEGAQFGILTPGYGEYERLQKEYLRDADVIYCCTPSMKPLFSLRLELFSVIVPVLKMPPASPAALPKRSALVTVSVPWL